jgi:hypothetical protein
MAPTNHALQAAQLSCPPESRPRSLNGRGARGVPVPHAPPPRAVCSVHRQLAPIGRAPLAANPPAGCS